jgi:natural product precursor
MKKQKFDGKLKLNKEVISKLDKENMSKIVGGYVTAHINTCYPCVPTGTNLAQCTIGCDYTYFCEV